MQSMPPACSPTALIQVGGMELGVAFNTLLPMAMMYSPSLPTSQQQRHDAYVPVTHFGSTVQLHHHHYCQWHHANETTMLTAS